MTKITNTQLLENILDTLEAKHRTEKLKSFSKHYTPKADGIQDAIEVVLELYRDITGRAG